MKVGVIAAKEQRDRQKFISRPLLKGGHDVRVLKTSPFVSFFFKLIHLLFRDKPSVFVFMGLGPKELLSYGIIKVFGMPAVVRLGGDRIRDLNSVAASLWRKGRYPVWLKFILYKYMALFFLRRIEWAIVVNEALATRVSSHTKTPQKLYVISQDCEGPPVPRDYGIGNPVELLTVLNFRYLEKAKGVIYLVGHLDEFVRKHEIPVRFRIAGDGLHLKEVKDYLKSKELSELLTVELAGFVTDLDGYYRRADVFLYRSLHDATPNVILESKRYGLPLLANDCEEFRSIIEHGVSGLLYSNKTEFYTFLTQLIMEKELREKIGQGALNEHETKFSINASQYRIEACLFEIIDASKKGK